MTLTPALIKELSRVLSPESLVTATEDLPAYGQDFREQRGVPGVVVRPHESTDVVATLRCAATHGVPVVPRAAGTNLAAGFVPTPEQILLDLRSLNRVLRLDPERREAVVQPGLINGELNAQLAPLGLCYSPDPASTPISTIGGNIATNAGGPHCLKYGVTFHHVTGLECALIGGDTMRLRADDAGPDLLGVVIGSEGTLAIVLEATLRLRPLPAETRTLLAVFADAEAAAEAVFAILATGVVPAALEYADAAAIRMFDGYAPSGYPADAGALLLVDVDGTAEEVAADLPVVEAVLRRAARHVWRADDAEHARGALARPVARGPGDQWPRASSTSCAIRPSPPAASPPCSRRLRPSPHAITWRFPRWGTPGMAISTRSSSSTVTMRRNARRRSEPKRSSSSRRLRSAARSPASMGWAARSSTAWGTASAPPRSRRCAPSKPPSIRPGCSTRASCCRRPAQRNRPCPSLPPRRGRRWMRGATIRSGPPRPSPGPRQAEARRSPSIRKTAPSRWVPRCRSRQLHDTLDAHGLCSPLPQDGDHGRDPGERWHHGASRGPRECCSGCSAQLPDGPAVHFGGSLLKDVAGYDLKRLYTGSGGRFGVLDAVSLQVRVQQAR